MQGRFRVKQGVTVIPPVGPRIKAGQFLDIRNEKWTRKQIEQKLAEGFIEDTSPDAAALADNPVELPPGVERPTPLPTGEKVMGVIVERGSEPPRDLNPIRIETKDKAKPVTQLQSVWIMNPANLEGLDLNQLNIMVAERDPHVKPFDTVEEAKSQLTKDFKPGQPDGVEDQDNQGDDKDPNGEITRTVTPISGDVPRTVGEK